MKAIKEATETSVKAARKNAEASMRAYQATIDDSETTDKNIEEAETTGKTPVNIKNNKIEERSPAEPINDEAIEPEEEAAETGNKPKEISKEAKGNMEARLESLAKMYENKKSQRTRKPEADSE